MPRAQPDGGLGTLLEDLHERGLLDETLVVVMGEFGRSPKVSHQAGRDHGPHAMSFLFSGGGIAEGRVIGATDRRGEHPAERPVGAGDFLATLYRHLGVDAERGTVAGPDGRPVSLLQQGGAPIPELSAAG